MGMRGAQSPAQTDTPALHSRASSFPSRRLPPHQVPHCGRFLYSSQKHATLPPPTPTLGGIGGRRFPGGVPRVQLALSCRCPSRSKRPRRVGRHKRPPTSGPPRRPVLPGGAVGPQGARKGNFCGWGSRSPRGLRGDLLECVRGEGAAGTRAARAGDSAFGPELQGASEDSAEPPTAPFPSRTPVHSPTPPALPTNATPGTPSRVPGPPHRAPRSPPRNPCGPATSIHRPEGTPPCTRRRLPFPASRSGRGSLGDTGIPARPARRPRPRRGRAEEQTETHRPLSAAGSGAPYRGGGGGSIAGWSRSARHPLGQTRGAGARRAQGARRRRLQPQLPPRPPGSAPPARPPSALAAGLRRLALGCERALSCHRPANAPSGWGREAGPAPRGTALPGGSASANPNPLPRPGRPSVCRSVCLESQTTSGVRSCPLSLVPSLGLAPMGPTSAGTSTWSFPRVNVGPKLEAGVKGGRAQATEGRGGAGWGGRELVARQAGGKPSAAPDRGRARDELRSSR